MDDIIIELEPIQPTEYFIYKLKYSNRDEAITDFISKNLINEEEVHNFPLVQNIVEVGLIPNLELSTEFESVYIDGYHFDVMLTAQVDFGDKEVVGIATPFHHFSGFSLEIDGESFTFKQG